MTMESTNAASNSVGTPAVSARILKKRETDRRCQRMIRERTKSRIAYLEGLVEQFRQQDSSGRVETLMKQLSDMKEDRDNLAKKVKNIESIISDSKLKEEPEIQSSPVSNIPAQPEESTPTPAVSVESNRSYGFPPVPSAELPPVSSPHDMPPTYQIHNKEYAAFIESSSRASWASSTTHPGHGPMCECATNSSTLDPSLPLNKWRYANDTLTEWFKWSPQALDMRHYAAYNDDVPVRAVVEGWDAVEKKGCMHPLWRLLKGIDQTIFGICAPRERLAILHTMGLLLQAHISPTRDQQSRIPSFYLKRPSQDMLHAYATEYFAWPGLRERFVFSEHRYCSNIFWKLFTPNLRVQWPYEFRDCYTKNIETGLYCISASFHERISDIRHWTMGIDMFKQYPELYGDIPADNHIPASITPTLSIPRQYQRALPSTASNQDIRNGRKKGDRPHPNHHQSSASVHTEHHSPMRQEPSSAQTQTMASNFSPLSTGSYDPVSATGYDYTHPGIVTSMAEMQQIQAMTPWAYNSNLDMFQLPQT